MAIVNGKEISRSELDKAYNGYKSNQGEAPQAPSPEQANIVRLNLLRQMIDEEILDQRAAKLNLAASEEDVNAKLTELKVSFTQEEFEKKLKQFFESGCFRNVDQLACNWYQVRPAFCLFAHRARLQRHAPLSRTHRHPLSA